MAKKYISKINKGGNNIYIKDSDAQSEITKIKTAVGYSLDGSTPKSSKADKVQNATADNFAALDSTGNLTDSGRAVMTAAQAETMFDNVFNS